MNKLIVGLVSVFAVLSGLAAESSGNASFGTNVYYRTSAPDLSSKNEIVITNSIGAWPKTVTRVFFEIENLDEACGEVFYVGSRGIVASGKDKGKPGKGSVLRPFDLPDCGRRSLIVPRGEVVRNLDTETISIRLALDKGVTRRFGVRQIRLLGAKEAPPSVEEAPRRNRREEREHAASLERFRQELGSDGLAVGVVSSMEAVRPRAAFTVRPATNVTLRLTQNEYESFQVVVTSMAGDLKDARVEFSSLKSKSSAERVRPQWWGLSGGVVG